MENDKTTHSKKETKKDKRHPGTTVMMTALGGLSALYLLNPGAGVIDLIPDNLPIIGNLDEAAATALLISVFAYFGLDISKVIMALLGMRKDKKAEGTDVPGTIDVETS